MKTINVETLTDNLTAIFIVTTSAGLIGLFFLKINFILLSSSLTYGVWLAACTLIYAIAQHFKTKNSSTFDFYQASGPVTPTVRRKKSNIEERVAIHIDEDGLDPMVLFNEEKSGVACILRLTELKTTKHLFDYLYDLNISVEQQGSPIDGQTLMEINYQQEKGYYRLTDNGPRELLDFAFCENSEHLYAQIKLAIEQLKNDNPALCISKVNVTNYQALQKFYHYVKRLNAPENRSIEYLSYYQGTLKICNTSYVALYDCTLQSTLTSWINQDGLIRTDNVEVELLGDNMLQLVDIELPYTECRLIDIQIVKMRDVQEGVKLYLTLVELNEGKLTNNMSGLTLLMGNNSIDIKYDEVLSDELISVEAYFNQKSYPEF
ncbi:hypothetical protein GCM10007916_01140 [Psychromonas marina]|uniref:Uncharacterized protein n=1 Tax=Psychromonas marina TaxID=88364 RepID=A0ABQ6DVC5_9GAMM|nr:hypothetical protein [Psychromonas marina]GLS89047.1 hypothetical protein GCM10007916_01140 [Psychromonas marina]